MPSDDQNSVELLRRGFEEETRSLNFRVGFTRNWEAVEESIRIIHQYNNFEAETVISKLRLTLPDAWWRIEIGREGSPVMYFYYLDADARQAVQQAMSEADADELDVQDGVLRAWWD